MNQKLNKETFKKIEHYLSNMDDLKREIAELKRISSLESPSSTDVGYLISMGEPRPMRAKSEEDILFIEGVLREREMPGYEFEVPCHHHVTNSSVCAVYGFHMSKCPLAQGSSYGCPAYDGGVPKTSVFEERVSQHLHYYYPEILMELADYLEVGETPPGSLMTVLRNLKVTFEKDGAKDYMNILLGRNVKKKTAAQKRKPFSTRERFEVLKKHNFSCAYCGRVAADGIKLHVDHVVPVSKGGTNDVENLVAACDECNLGKSDIPL